MEVKKFEFISEYPECVILRKKLDCGYKHVIRDCEGEIIKMVVTQTEATPPDFYRTAEEYSLAEIRKIKMENELKWRREFVKA